MSGIAKHAPWLQSLTDFVGLWCGRGGLVRPTWPDGHEIGGATLAFAGLDQSTHAPAGCARPGATAARLDPRISGLGVDHDPFAVDDVLALTDHDIAAQGDGLGFEIVNAEVAARALVFGEDGHSAARLNAPDVLGAFAAAKGRLAGHCGGCFAATRLANPDFLAVKDNQAAAAHRGVALHDLDIAGEGRGFAFVVNFERGGLDLDRSILVFELARLGRGGRRASLREARLRQSTWCRCDGYGA